MLKSTSRHFELSHKDPRKPNIANLYFKYGTESGGTNMKLINTMLKSGYTIKYFEESSSWFSKTKVRVVLEKKQ